MPVSFLIGEKTEDWGVDQDGKGVLRRTEQGNHNHNLLYENIYSILKENKRIK